LFGGTSKVDTYASNMVFFNGTGPGAMNLGGQSNNQTFAQYQQAHPSTDATTLLNSQNQASEDVVLWADFYAETPSQQSVSLIHEFIHSYFDLTDPDHSDIISQFGITVPPGETNTQAIDQWIGNNCKN